MFDGAWPFRDRRDDRDEQRTVVNLLSDLPVPGVPARFSFSNAYAPTRNVGTELLLRWRTGPFVVLVAYGYVNATELPPDVLVRRTVPLNPRHSANFTATWEKEEIGRIGVECFFTRHQALIDNPYRSTSPSFVMFGLLVQRQFGSASVFLNGENLTGKRQTRFDSLVLPARAADGRWTTDEWSPLDGRVINLRVRWRFGEAAHETDAGAKRP